ncbi:hypothetical protein V6N11_024554 [Hibiscus sabdariffa]|uniref:Defensin-like protein n=1 Tax=Hibiscus sabdariffa TaxID=183260 RepID=A0ABR2QMG9_9ROSI
MRICNENCNARCEVSNNGKGNVRNRHRMCKSLNECGDNHDDGNLLASPSNKQCSMGIGPCNEHYNDSCCDRLCYARYQGLKHYRSVQNYSV